MQAAGLAAVKVDVDDDWALGVTATYMFSNRFGIELLAATPFKHDITVDGADIDAGEINRLVRVIAGEIDDFLTPL